MSSFPTVAETLRRDVDRARTERLARQKALTAALTMALAGLIVLIGIVLATVTTGLISGPYPDGEIVAPEFTSRV